MSHRANCPIREVKKAEHSKDGNNSVETEEKWIAVGQSLSLRQSCLNSNHHEKFKAIHVLLF